MSNFQNAVLALLNALKIHMGDGVFKMDDNDLEEVVVLAWKSQHKICTLTSSSFEAARFLDAIAFSLKSPLWGLGFMKIVKTACYRAQYSGESLSDSIVWQGFGASEIMSAIRFCEVCYSVTED